MSDAWGGHRAAAFAAVSAIGDLQEALSLATDATERAMGAVAEAVGNSLVDAAAQAQGTLAGVTDRIQEIYGMTNAAKDDLERYIAGF